jgi:hypothetical protein
VYAYKHQYASKKRRVGEYLGITKIMQRQQQMRTEMVLHDKFVKSKAFASGITQVMEGRISESPQRLGHRSTDHDHRAQAHVGPRQGA